MANIQTLRFVIYRATCVINKKVYIGKTNNFMERKRKHLGKDNRCPAFKNAINKYGKDNFVWDILSETNDECEAYRLETSMISLLNATNKRHGYNLSDGGGGVTGYHAGDNNPAKRPDVRHKLSIGRMGIVFTEEHRRNLSKAKLGKKRPPHTEETKQKMRLAALGEKNHNTGKKWITNGDTDMIVNLEDMKHLLKNGWVAGRKFRPRKVIRC